MASPKTRKKRPRRAHNKGVTVPKYYCFQWKGGHLAINTLRGDPVWAAAEAYANWLRDEADPCASWEDRASQAEFKASGRIIQLVPKRLKRWPKL